jgi:hypothetical protein
MDQAMSRSGMERGPIPTSLATLVALLPLVLGIAAGVAADQGMTVGPLGPNLLVYWVIVPLAALYPTIAAFARRLAYAPMTVLVMASLAPALVYAGRILLEPLPKGPTGQLALTPNTILYLTSPAILAVGAFIAIEVTTAAMRRGVAVGVFGAIAGAFIFAASFLAPFLYVSQLLPT